MNKTGKDYEKFVADIQQVLLDLEKDSHLKNIEIEMNKKIEDRSGIKREFDIYWEFKYGGNVYRTIIECKDYSSAVSIEKIDALLGKTSDIPGLRLIYATKTGYQSGAAEKAKKHNIDLLIIREFRESDWTMNDGIREIHIKATMISTPRITHFTYYTSQLWLEQNQLSENWAEKECQAFFQYLNNEIFIHDMALSERYSLYELAQKLPKKHKTIQYGKGKYSEELSNAYLESSDNKHRIKILGYELAYEFHEPVTTQSVIAKEILGFVQNFNTQEKQFITADMLNHK